MARLFACLALTVPSACSEAPPAVLVPPQALPTLPAITRDGIVAAAIPSDLVTSIHERSLFGTSADGSFRLFVEHRPGEDLPAVLGTLKDELIGLGWEPGEEQHFQAAVSFTMARGPKQARLERATWIIEVAGRVLVCEAIASDVQAARLGTPLRDLCQALTISAPPPPATERRPP